MGAKYPFINKELSWLSFNERVLQEAEDTTVPLLARIRFLGIYSSNMDEFFRVRVATLRRIAVLGAKKFREVTNDESPSKILLKIQEIFLEQHKRFDTIYEGILAELASLGVHVVDEHSLSGTQRTYVKKYFKEAVRPKIFPVMIDRDSVFPPLVDRSVYLYIVFDSAKPKAGKNRFRCSLIELPTDTLSRFILLPEENGKRFVMLLDDVIRCGLEDIFAPFDCVPKGAYSIKIIRDAELDIEMDLSESIIHKINKSLKKRKQGSPVRFSHDADIPADALVFLLKKMGLRSSDSILAGGKYNNYRDLAGFPPVIPDGQNPGAGKIPHPDLVPGRSIMRAIDAKDILLHFPWHPFDTFIDLLREAAIDPDVAAIRITLYRVARNSNVVNALINARRNGKQVTVILELQARFDEEANIYWSDRLREEGAHVIYGVYGLKVHSKLCLIERTNPSKRRGNYVCVGTGNFNEATARVYTDCLLLSSHRGIADEVRALFDFFEHNFKVPKFDHLLVSPFYARKKIVRLIERETENARAGRPAWIRMKLNNLSDPDMAKYLYEASIAGVRVQLLVRGMFSLVTGQASLSERIEAAGIVDSFLEHSRILIFSNAGTPEYFISSSDWLPRNFDRRIEVTCPVYDPALKQQLQDLFDISWRDNVKARVLDSELVNSFRKDQSEPFRSQHAIGEYLSKRPAD
jgi:polyphosphate kinase